MSIPQNVSAAIDRFQAALPRQKLVERNGRLVLPYGERRSVSTETKEAARAVVASVAHALIPSPVFVAFALGLARNESAYIPCLQAYTLDETDGWGLFQFNDGAMDRTSRGDDFGTSLTAAQALTSMRGGHGIPVAYQLSVVGQVVAPLLVYRGVYLRGRYLLQRGQLDAEHSWLRRMTLDVWERAPAPLRSTSSAFCLAAAALTHVYHGGPGYWMMPFPFGRLDQTTDRRSASDAARNLQRTKERFEHGLEYIEREWSAI